jgi:hypothetical protein
MLPAVSPNPTPSGRLLPRVQVLALLWQIYSSCMFAYIHLWQCGHRFGGIQAMSATMA